MYIHSPEMPFSHNIMFITEAYDFLMIGIERHLCIVSCISRPVIIFRSVYIFMKSFVQTPYVVAKTMLLHLTKFTNRNHRKTYFYI